MSGHGGVLARRLLWRVLLFSLCFTVLAGAVQLFFEYRREMREIEARLELIRSGYLALSLIHIWVRPRLAVIMETELWPNHIHACAVRGIPVALANARLSERSARGYARFAGLTRPMLAQLSWICLLYTSCSCAAWRPAA